MIEPPNVPRPCENCGIIASPVRKYANLLLCQACFEETHKVLNTRIQPKPDILWLAIDLSKLATLGAAADSGEWIGKFIVATMKSASATELNNLASLLDAAKAVAFDAYQKTVKVYHPAPVGAPLPSPRASKQKSWDELLAEI